MKYETTPSARLPKIGFGTWKIGGAHHADPRTDPVSMAALRAALEYGYTHFDTAEMYAGGHSEELLGRAIRESGVKRESLFITTKVMPSHLRYEQVLASCEKSLKRLGTDYVDLYLIHWPGERKDYKETFRALNKLVRDGRVRHLGVSNFDLDLLKHSQSLSETPILTNQVPYSLFDRSYVRNGILEYCRQNDIILTAYSPVDEGRLRPNKTLDAIARAHNATRFQIAIAWLIAQPRVTTIPMSLNPRHIRENIEAADIELSGEEMAQLTSL